MIKKILLFLLVALIIIQFIQPKKNKAEGAQPNYIGTAHAVPEDIKLLLDKTCNDCHSNNTKYPWYSRIQPVSWWLDNHIRDGKKELNFDEYTHKSPRYQYHKLEEIVEMVEEGEMPLKSYTWVHRDALLTQEERVKLTGWAKSSMEVMKTRYPIDSLVSKK